MRVLGRVLLWSVIALGGIGMIGMIWVALESTNKGVVRPDRQLEALLEEMGVADRLSIVITRNRFIIYEKTWPEGSSETTFPLGSLGELFVAAAAQHLHDTGTLDLDAPIGTWLDDLTEPLAALTPHALLTHTSGLRDDRPGELVSEPGSTSFYAGSGYALLERAIVAASGRTVVEIVTDELAPRLAKGLEYDALVDLTITDLSHVADEDGRAVWSASARDLIRWELALNTGLLTKMKTHLRATRPARLSGGGVGAFGYGWEISNYRGLRLEEWVAREPGLGANVTRFSEKNFAVVILTDQGATTFDTRALARRIGDFYLGREFPQRDRFGVE